LSLLAKTEPHLDKSENARRELAEKGMAPQSRAQRAFLA
jgi:hypothetical protein